MSEMDDPRSIFTSLITVFPPLTSSHGLSASKPRVFMSARFLYEW